MKQSINWQKVRRFCRAQFLKEWSARPNIHSSHYASAAIDAACAKFGIGHGSEGFCDSVGRHGITYLNMGDTYDTTILFDSSTDRFSIGCWGDIVERAPEGRYA